MVINFETRGSNGNFEPGYVTLLLKGDGDVGRFYIKFRFFNIV